MLAIVVLQLLLDLLQRLSHLLRRVPKTPRSLSGRFHCRLERLQLLFAGQPQRALLFGRQVVQHAPQLVTNFLFDVILFDVIRQCAPRSSTVVQVHLLMLWVLPKDTSSAGQPTEISWADSRDL